MVCKDRTEVFFLTSRDCRGAGCQLVVVFTVTMKVKAGFACQLRHGGRLEEGEPEEEEGGSPAAMAENRSSVR